ncbi:MAG: hypothetical protein M0P66_08520 [Salinivirgaceae bacterium]|nr:hypothetical protein [Salinivirgaceae bacterium]
MLKLFKAVILIVTLLWMTIKPHYGASLDNILKVVIYQQEQNNYLILHESFYHPQSESYSKGNTRSIGYNSSRLSVYDLSNGKLVTQKEMGRMDSTEACLVLGCTPGNLWIYSKKYKSGLQSLNPLTLERKTTQAYIYVHLHYDIGRFVEPDWNEMNQFYGFDRIQQKVIVTNHVQEKYLIDMEKFTAEKMVDPVNINPDYKPNLKSAAKFCGENLKMDGFDWMVIKNSKETYNKTSFLFGQFIIDVNIHRLFLHYLEMQENFQLEIESLSKPNLTDFEVSRKAALEYQQSLTKTNLTALFAGRKPDDVLLMPNKESFFVYSKAEDTDASVIQVSKIHCDEKNQMLMEWKTTVPGMFYNISTARNTREFKAYFGDFPPQIDGIHFELVNNQLLIFYLTQVCGIDVNTGKIQWSFSVKY